MALQDSEEILKLSFVLDLLNSSWLIKNVFGLELPRSTIIFFNNQITNQFDCHTANLVVKYSVIT